MANEKQTTEKEIIKPATVYGRIQRVRNELQKLNLKKSGKNKFTGNTYYELGDFEPQLNRLCDEQGIMPLFTLKKEIAVLRVINVDKPEESVTFFIPSIEAEVKGALGIQNLGAQITYLRRYLLMIAFEISESDMQDSQPAEDIERLDQIHIDKINAVKTLPELAKVSGELQKELGAGFRKALVAEYTRRKKEIEKAVPESVAK